MVLRVLKWALVLLVLGVAVVAALITVGPGLTIGLSASTLQEGLAKAFPLRNCSGSVACLEVSKPAVQLPDGSDRVVVTADVVASIVQRQYPGKLVINGRVRYVRASGSVFLDDVQIEQLQLDGLPAPLVVLVKSQATAVLHPLLTRQPVYVLKADTRIGALARRWLSDVKVADGQLRLTFQAIR